MPCLNTRDKFKAKGDLDKFGIGEVIKPLEKNKVEVSFTNEGLYWKTMMEFILIRDPSPYNVILSISDARTEGRRYRNERRRKEGIGPQRRSFSQPSFPRPAANHRQKFNERMWGLIKKLLKKNIDIFAWEPSDMMGFPWRIIEHTLNAYVSVEHIGRNLEAYVDDMVIKSNDERMLLADIIKTFDNLRRINMKLNLKKFSYGMEGDSKGNAKSKRKLATLKCFLARSIERSLPFFNTIKNVTKENNDEYRWIKEVEKAFQEIKKLVMELPSLTTSFLKKTLYVYIASSKESRLRMYIKAHLVEVITNQPIKQTINKEEASSELAKYAVELGVYGITYEPQS
ncbi:hypothetical protein Tco_0323315 [Tanacetum coccineum]